MSTPSAASRIMLVEEPSRLRGSAPRVRRYRMARVQLNPRPGLQPVEGRFAHLKRMYD
jgi:ferric-dicitrate binding protein FerR (iron transport regulator)